VSAAAAVITAGATYDVDGDTAHCAVRLGRQILEDVGAVELQQLVSDGKMMVFEHRVVVVHHRQFQSFTVIVIK